MKNVQPDVLYKQSVNECCHNQYSRLEEQVKSQSCQLINPLLPLLILLTGCLTLTVFIRYRLVFVASSDIGGIESNVIYSIQRYMAGYPLYANPEAAPFSITQYSPLYYRVVSAFGYLTGSDPDNTLSIYRLSRIISLAANIIYALLLLAFSHRLHPNWKVSTAVVIAAFVLLPPQTYSRPDSIYIALVISTLYAGLRAVQAKLTNQIYGWLVVVVVMAALSIATKQSGVVLPLILIGYYGIALRKWLVATALGVSIAVLAMGFLIGLMPEHDPTLLYVNIVKGVSQGFDITSFKVNIVDHFFRTFSLHNAVGLPMCVWLIRQSKTDYKWLGWVMSILFSFSFCVSLKSGSALNYFTEYVALTGLAAAIWIQQQTNLVEAWVNRSLVLTSAVFWAVVPNMPNFNWPLALNSNAISEAPYYQQKQVADYLKDSLSLKPDEAVFVTNYNYCYLNGLLYRNCLVPQQEIVAIMYPAKKLDYTALKQQIDLHRIRFLITRSDEKITFFEGLTTRDYNLQRRFSSFDVYELSSPHQRARALIKELSGTDKQN